MDRNKTRLPLLALAVVALVAALAGVGCGGSSSDSEASEDGDGGGGKLTLVAYSTPEEAYKELIPAFNKTPEGEGVSFDQSYASSGEQSRAVEGGLPADVVEFSLEPDITRLVDAGLVDEDWNQNEYKGMVTDSVVVFMVRKGNPKNIKTWDDLVTGDVEVLEPNPFTSGSAKWNIMAAYGAQLEQGKTPEQAKQYLAKLFENVPVLDKSAREALQTFSSGKGDVLLGYENEAILAQQQGEEVDYVIPDETLLIENPIAVVNESEESGAGPVVRGLPLHARGPGDLRLQGLPACGGGCQGSGRVPDSRHPVRDQQVRRLGQGQRRVLRARGQRRGRHLPVAGEEHCLRLRSATARRRRRPQHR